MRLELGKDDVATETEMLAKLDAGKADGCTKAAFFTLLKGCGTASKGTGFG